MPIEGAMRIWHKINGRGERFLWPVANLHQARNYLQILDEADRDQVGLRQLFDSANRDNLDGGAMFLAYLTYRATTAVQESAQGIEEYRDGTWCEAEVASGQPLGRQAERHLLET
jgi:hypothetical protein